MDGLGGIGGLWFWRCMVCDVDGSGVSKPDGYDIWWYMVDIDGGCEIFDV